VYELFGVRIALTASYTKSSRMKLKKVRMMRAVLNAKILMRNIKGARAIYERKTLTNSRDLWPWYPELKHL